MYRGVRLDVRIHNYDTAYQALAERAKRSKVRGADVLDPTIGVEASLGHPRSQVTGIRLLRDNSIACRLFSTDVVTWHPDNSVSVISHPTVTTAAFANALLPGTLRLGGESEIMTFFPGCDRASGWYDRWAKAHVCDATGTYRCVDDVWMPDEDTLNQLPMLEFNRTISRQVCREYPFAKFKTWLFAACNVMDIEHLGTDLHLCADALLDGKFRKAAEHLPTITIPDGFGLRSRIKPLRMRSTHWDSPVTLGSVEHLRRWLYADAGAYKKTFVTTMPLAEYTKQTRLTGQLRQVGVYGY